MENHGKHHAIQVAIAVVGMDLARAWKHAQSAGLKLKVRLLDNERIRTDQHDDDSHISVNVTDGIVKKAWVG